jgi:hypothetical protein
LVERAGNLLVLNRAIKMLSLRLAQGVD